MNIVVLENIEMTDEQIARLRALADLELFGGSTQEECKERIRDKDVVIVDWIDPSPFILSMKSPSLLALMSTGYDWIQHRSEAGKKGILISNVPGYAAESVAEHLLGLVISVARRTMVGDRNIRAGNTKKGYLRGIELKGRRIGIIGLGNIGKRVAELAKCLGMDVVTFNRQKKSNREIRDVSLENLLSSSDVICISCPLNNESKGMLDKARLALLKPQSIVVSATWDVVVIEDLIRLIREGRIFGAGFDAAIEGAAIDLPPELLSLDNVILTPHIAYNTTEAKTRQVDTCISNVEGFLNRRPRNIINC